MAHIQNLKVLEASGKSTESNVETLLTQEIYSAMPKGFDEILEEEEKLVNQVKQKRSGSDSTHDSSDVPPVVNYVQDIFNQLSPDD